MSINAASLMVQVDANTAAAEGKLKSLSGQIGGFMGTMRTAVGAAGLAADAALGLSVKTAANYQQMIQQIQANTGASDDQMAAMSKRIQAMADESGAPIEALGQGWLHIAALTKNYAGALGILDTAQKSALATGGDVEAYANIAAMTMHEYGLDTSTAATETQRLADVQANSANVMGLLHRAGQDSNLTMENLATNTGIVIGTAARLNIPLNDVVSAYVALTKHGFSADTAQTQLNSGLTHLIHPSKAAATELERVSKLTGVDLVSDFSAAALSSKGLMGVTDDLRAAYLKLGLSPAQATEETMKLVNAQRGGLGIAALITNGYEDYANEVQRLADKQANAASITEGYGQRQLTLKAQVSEVGAEFAHAGRLIGDQFLAPLVGLINSGIKPAVTAVLGFIQAHAQLAAAILAGVGAIGTLVGGFAAVHMGALLLGPALGPIVGLLGGLLVPIAAVAAASGLLALAWQNDWGGIRETAQQALTTVQTAWPAIQAAISKALATIGADIQTVVGIVQKVWSERMASIQTSTASIWASVQKIVATATSAVSGFIQQEFGVVIAWVQQNWPLIQATVQRVMEIVSAVVDTALKLIVGFWNDHGATIMRVASDNWNTIKAVIDTAIHVVLDVITLVMDLITGNWSGAWDQVKDIASRIWELIKTVVGSGLDAVKALVSDFGPALVGLLGGIASDAGTAASAIGSAIIGGIRSGIEGGVGAIRDAAAGVAQSALDAAKGALGIASPSKAFADLGDLSMQGFAQGINSSSSKVRAATSRAALAALEPFKDAVNGTSYALQSQRAQVSAASHDLQSQYQPAIDALNTKLHEQSAALTDTTRQIQAQQLAYSAARTAAEAQGKVTRQVTAQLKTEYEPDLDALKAKQLDQRKAIDDTTQALAKIKDAYTGLKDQVKTSTQPTIDGLSQSLLDNRAALKAGQETIKTGSVPAWVDLTAYLQSTTNPTITDLASRVGGSAIPALQHLTSAVNDTTTAMTLSATDLAAFVAQEGTATAVQATYTAAVTGTTTAITQNIASIGQSDMAFKTLTDHLNAEKSSALGFSAAIDKITTSLAISQALAAQGIHVAVSAGQQVGPDKGPGSIMIPGVPGGPDSGLAPGYSGASGVTIGAVRSAINQGYTASQMSQFYSDVAGGKAHLAAGGIAMRPMTADIAENEPEAVIPLSRLGSMTGGGQTMNLTITVTGNTMLGSETRVARELAAILSPEIDRFKGGLLYA